MWTTVYQIESFERNAWHCMMMHPTVTLSLHYISLRRGKSMTHDPPGHGVSSRHWEQLKTNSLFPWAICVFKMQPLQLNRHLTLGKAEANKKKQLLDDLTILQMQTLTRLQLHSRGRFFSLCRVGTESVALVSRNDNSFLWLRWKWMGRMCHCEKEWRLNITHEKLWALGPLFSVALVHGNLLVNSRTDDLLEFSVQ